MEAGVFPRSCMAKTEHVVEQVHVKAVGPASKVTVVLAVLDNTSS